LFNQRYRAHPDGTLMIIMLGVFTAFAPLSIDLYLPGMPAMEADFGVSAGLVQQSLSLFFVGLAGGQLLYGPLADRFGRRYPLLAGSLIYHPVLSGCSPGVCYKASVPRPAQSSRAPSCGMCMPGDERLRSCLL
jgi:MFS family permease